jgi:hypothetical protein
MTMAIGLPSWRVVMGSMYGISLHLRIARGFSPSLDGSGI